MKGCCRSCSVSIALCLLEVTLSALNATESDVDIEALSEHQLTTWLLCCSFDCQYMYSSTVFSYIWQTRVLSDWLHLSLSDDCYYYCFNLWFLFNWTFFTKDHSRLDWVPHCWPDALPVIQPAVSRHWRNCLWAITGCHNGDVSLLWENGNFVSL